MSFRLILIFEKKLILLNIVVDQTNIFVNMFSNTNWMKTIYSIIRKTFHRDNSKLNLGNWHRSVGFCQRRVALKPIEAEGSGEEGFCINRVNIEVTKTRWPPFQRRR